jgi:hypothetical protein
MAGLNTDAMEIIIELLVNYPDRCDSERLDKQSPSHSCICDAMVQLLVAR